MVVKDLLDHMRWAADQNWAIGNVIFQILKGGPVVLGSSRRHKFVIVGTEAFDRRFGRACQIETTGTSANNRSFWIMTIMGQPFTIVIDQGLVLGLMVESIGGKERLAILGRQLSGKRARRAAVPDGNRLLKGAWLGGNFLQRRPIAPIPSDIFFALEYAGAVHLIPAL